MQPGEPLPVGHMLDGRYRIHEVLGQGGMGRVYLANDTRLANRPVAAKEMILGGGIQEQKAIEDFNREASVLAKLSHPSIPQVIDYFGERGRHYLIMEYVAGGDLQAHLDKLGPRQRVPENEVLRWARQILEVLQFLHSQKPPIIYRDLKPGNIMIDLHGRAMLIDFGIARFLPPGGRGTQIGSVGYAPPEQYLGKLEARSDIYALAATIHHLLTGRDPQLEPPFSFPPVRQLAPEVSPKTESVVMRALDKELDKRPRSAREMLDLLPNPGAEPASASDRLATTAGSGRSAASQIGELQTVVLARPALPAASNARPAPAVRLPAKAKGMARSKTQRSLGLPGIPSAPRAAISSTAKTRDLGLKSKSPAPAPSAAQPAVKPTPKAPARARMAAAFSSVRAVIKSASSAAAASSPASAAKPPNRRPATGTSDTSRPSVSSSITPVRLTPSSSPNGAVAHRSSPVEVASAWLVAPADGGRFGLTGARIVIGRAESVTDAVDIDLSSLPRGIERVSRRHAEIIKQGLDYFIRDLGSLNGTYIVGRGRLGRDQLYKLKDRDEVVLGGAKLEFRRG
jgi:serine/threonine protein kinase